MVKIKQIDFEHQQDLLYGTHRGRRKCLGDIVLFIANTKINQTNIINYLGVIDAKLNWISHITYVKTKLPKELELSEMPDHC